MRRPRGFTLIELMVVVAVVAIIAAIAVPSFVSQLKKSRRSEAMKSASDLQLREERYRASNSTYGTLAQVISPTTTTYYNTANSYYNMSISGNTATGYVITATAKLSQVGEHCGNFIMTNTNGTIVKTTSTGQTDCW